MIGAVTVYGSPQSAPADSLMKLWKMALEVSEATHSFAKAMREVSAATCQPDVFPEMLHLCLFYMFSNNVS